MSALKLFSSMAVVAVLICGADAFANTCAGSCGGPSPDGSCYCDDLCSDYGDCCGDICTHCPTAPGCGGNGGGCGSVTYEGCCQGEVIQFCDGGALQTIDCMENPSCGWSSEGNFYDCGTPGGADPSGMNPKACTGGTGPVCGNGSCENGESSQTCPQDCGGNNPVCGNGFCENGETAQTCPQDCGGGNQPVCGNGACENGESAESCPQDCGQGCGGKQCGFDGQGNPCGTCPDGFYCTWDGLCESDTPCEADCGVKQCGDDGCGGQCGTCPAGLICSESDTCISPFGQDVSTSDEDVNCTPDCSDRVCGNDGCGGSCGTCPEGYGCTGAGMCEEGYVPPPANDVTDGVDPYACPEGETLLYGKCVASVDDSGGSSGCAAGSGSMPGAGWLLIVLMAGLMVVRRRFA